jgi:pyruvate formate lyase activating enzyme
MLIGRDWYDLTGWNISADGSCAACGTRCDGVFEAAPGRWGRRRQPVQLQA